MYARNVGAIRGRRRRDIRCTPSARPFVLLHGRTNIQGREQMTMSGSEQKLTAEQKELVAIGASVGVGCLPCASYHFKAGQRAGLEAGRILSVVADAERVSADATERMSAHVREELGRQATAAPAPASALDGTLAALGAAIGANSIPNIERHMVAAAASGLSGAQLAETVMVAQLVQQMAAKGHLEKAERLLERFGSPSVTVGDDSLCADDCPCHATKEVPHVL